MAKIILFPTHEGYCRTCAYSSGNGTCNNKKYNEHQYEVNCVWKYCPYRKEKAGFMCGIKEDTESGEATLDFTMCHISGRDLEMIVMGCLQLGERLGMFDGRKEKPE